MSTKDLGDLGVAAGDIIDKAFTLGYETGRKYVPPGGMALTAEQVEDVRLLAQMCPWWSAEHVEQVQARVRSMLPATEPAEDGWGDVNPNDPQGRTYRETAEEYYSAPAELAEEETKAETCAGIFQGDRAYLCALAAGHYGDHTTANGEHWQKSSSSPVVPAPTETAEGSDRLDNVRQCLVCGLQKDWRDMAIWRDADGAGHWVHPHCSPATPAETGPWQRIEDVPVGVPFKDREGSGLVKLADGQFGYVDNYRETSKTLAEFAPFVAAEEG